MARVVALAGRRIDAADAANPFSPRQVRGRSRSVAALLRAERIEALVCSAACGADLIALEAAGALGLRRRVVLPSRPPSFETAR